MASIKKIIGAAPGGVLVHCAVSDYRIVYAIEDDRILVLVLRVAHWREVGQRVTV